MKVTIRKFPSLKEGRRASFMAIDVNVEITKDKVPTVEDLFNSDKTISPTTHKVARGITYLKLSEPIISGEILNVIPLV